MDDHTTDPLLETPETPGEAEPASPLGRRFGRLAIVFGAVVLAALGLNAMLGARSEPTAEEPNRPALGISPADRPRGALAGEPAPAFRLNMFDGSTFDLAEHVSTDGRPIVLNFWASWCFPCRTEMPEFDQVARARPDVLFVGIAIEDNLEPARQFADEIQVSYPLGIDETGDIAQAYPNIGLPTTYLIAGDGTVVRQIQGQVRGEELEALIDFDFGGE